jgi:TonB family protein
MLEHTMSRSALFALACFLCLGTPALADERRQIDVPAGELIAALKALTQQSGVDLVYRSEQLEGLSTQGVSGAFTPQEALTRLLEGTALTVKTEPSGAMLIALPRSAPTSGSTPSSAPKAPSADAPLSAAATVESRHTSVQRPAARSADTTIDSVTVEASTRRELLERQLSTVVSEVNESASPAAYPRAGTDIEGALARVNAAKSSADADPLALADALTALGDAYLDAGQHAKAEASYNEALLLAERHAGLESERVLPSLLGLGKTLAASRRHQQAVPRLQRALAIQRSQYGLFDLRQQDTLKTLAASLTALDRTAEAQDLMIYRVRTAEKNYGEAKPNVIPAVCELGDWFAEVGMAAEARMTFQMALNIAGDSESLNAPIIVEPLRGIARTYMRRMSYPKAWLTRTRPHHHCQGQGPCWFPNDPPDIQPSGLSREGERALQRALRILEADPGASMQTLIETLIQMGDWRQIEKAPREALPYYQRAWKLIHETASLSRSAATALNVPVRVYYPTPQIVVDVPEGSAQETRSNYVQVEFTVAADGSVQDARIVDHDTRKQYAQEIFDAVRAARFRPKFIEGQAVAATGITYREVFWTRKPRD